MLVGCSAVARRSNEGERPAIFLSLLTCFSFCFDSEDVWCTVVCREARQGSAMASTRQRSLCCDEINGNGMPSIKHCCIIVCLPCNNALILHSDFVLLFLLVGLITSSYGLH